MAKSSQRSRSGRGRERQKGRKHINIVLSPEATEKLNALQEETGDSITKIIDRLIIDHEEATTVRTDLIWGMIRPENSRK